MSEHGPTNEPQEPLFALREQCSTHLERAGHRLSATEFDLLVTRIGVEDLSNDPLIAVVGRTPLAKRRGREVTVDQGFQNFTSEQQTHFMLHESAHSLVRFLRDQQNPERYNSIADRISQLPPDQVSYYVSYLQEKAPQNDQLIQSERLAEVFAQYLESDRSFSGFIQAKLLEFPQGDREISEEQRAIFEQYAAQIGELGEYLDIAESEEEWEGFLAHHSDLLPHYQLWREMDALFDETDFTQLGAYFEAQLDKDGEDELWEDFELADHIHLEPPAATPRTIFSSATPAPDSEPRPFSDLLTFWRLFPPKEVS